MARGKAERHCLPHYTVSLPTAHNSASLWRPESPELVEHVDWQRFGHCRSGIDPLGRGEQPMEFFLSFNQLLGKSANPLILIFVPLFLVATLLEALLIMRRP